MKSNFSYGLIITALFSLSVKINAQSPDSPAWAWAKSLSATYSIYGHAIAIDPNGSGDIYLAGGFEGTTDFDPGPDVFELYSGSSGNVSNFISKYDASGNFVWARAMPAIGGNGSPYSMAIDPLSGAIITTGRFEGTLDFDPGPNSYNLKSVGLNDIFISKLDSEGNFIWSKAMGGPSEEFGISLAYDPEGDGSIYITGQFKGTVDFDPDTANTFNLTTGGNFDIFISKLNGLGEFQWALKLGWVGNDLGRAIAFDPEGEYVYTSGQFYGKVDFNPDTARADTFYLKAGSGHENFILKLDKSGNFVWAKQMGKVNASVLDRFGSIVIDPDGGGEVYVTGPFKGKGDFDPGEDADSLTSVANSVDVFISKFSPDGEYKWAGAIGGPAQDDCIDIAVEPGGSGNVFTLGMFKETADFDPGPDSFKLTSGGGQDLFISKLDKEGNFQWVEAVQGVANAYGQGIVTDNQFVYVTGTFFGTNITFDSITLTNADTGGADLFFAKLDINVVFPHARIYVKQDATGNNDGTSWQNAFTKLQPALNQADHGDHIWIAAGTYIPEGPSADSSHFLLKKGVKMYGGFSGTESTLSERKLWMDTTTISGDILGDDVLFDFSSYRIDNAHQVLIIDGGDTETILDGILFSGGSTRLDEYVPDSIDSLAYDRWSGGALYIRNTSVEVNNCIFRDNEGFYGSALYACYIDSNVNNLVVKNSTFEGNKGAQGAGLCFVSRDSVENRHIEIESCTFKNNIAYYSTGLDGGTGGAIYTRSTYSTQTLFFIRNCEFLQNYGFVGGAISSNSQNMLIDNSHFEQNVSGGIHWAFGGSAIYFYGGQNDLSLKKLIVRNTLFNSNNEYGSLGTVWITHGNAFFENITMVDNSGGLQLSNGYIEIQNSIFENENHNLILYSGNILTKGGNISSDATLSSFLNGYNDYADLNLTNPLLDPDFIPLSGSPCIDAGNPEGADALYDLAGNPRIQGNGIDVGAYESPFTVAVKNAVWDSQVLKVFPNPVNDVFYLELESDWIGDISFSIYNVQGQPVYLSKLNKPALKQTFTENLNFLSPGEYGVLVKSGKTTYATKIVVQR